MPLRRGLLPLLFLIPLVLSAPASARQMDATRLELQGDRLVLEGRVRIGLGRCELRANAVRIELTRRVLNGEQVALCGGQHGLWLWAHRLRLGPEGALEAELVRGAPCACPGARPPLTFTARRARVAPGGRRVHLSWPVVRVFGLPVAALPYLLLPLGPGVSGLLAPELGYSGRDGLRLSQPVYLALDEDLDLLLAAGWIQHRGARGRARLRARAGPATLQLEARGLRDDGHDRGQLLGRAVARGRSWAVVASPDLVSDSGVARILERPVERVLAPHLRSRAWAGAASGSLYLHGRGDLLQQLVAPARGSWITGAAALALGLSPTRLLGPALLALQGGVEHYNGALDPGSGAVDHTTWIHLRPELLVADRLGPLRLSARGRYRLAAVAGRVAPPGSRAMQAGLASLEAAVPLGRAFGSGGLLHLLEPVAGLSWSGVDGTRYVTPDGVEVRDGAAGRVGLRTELWIRSRSALPRRAAALDLVGELPLARPQGDPSDAALLVGDLELRPMRALHARLGVSWAPVAGRLPRLRAGLCAEILPGARLCGGYRRLRLQRVDELLQGGPLLGEPWAAGLLPWELRADQVDVGLQGGRGPLSASARVAWDPVLGELAYARVGAGVSFGCGCYRVGAEGLALSGQRWPDLLLVLAYTGQQTPGCLGR